MIFITGGFSYATSLVAANYLIKNNFDLIFFIVFFSTGVCSFATSKDESNYLTKKIMCQKLHKLKKQTRKLEQFKF